MDATAPTTTAPTTTDPTPAGAAAQSHDMGVGPALAALMASSWGTPDASTMTARQPVAAYTADRRRRLAACFPGEVLVIPTGTEVVRSNDDFYPFRAGSDYMWLVGDKDPDRVLVIDGRSEEPVSTVYAAERGDLSSDRFYTDRRSGELWVGPRRGPIEIAAAFDIPSLADTALVELVASLGTDVTVRVLTGIDPTTDTLVAGRPDGSAELATALGDLRLVKDEFEIAAMERAVAATATGFDEVLADLPTAAALERGERWLEGTFWRRARTDGNEVGYGSIVACGGNATTLHWQPKDGRVRSGELLLLDMGVETDELYTADITRTVPVSGTFTGIQRQVYQAVLDAQQAGIDAVRPGVDFLAVHGAAMASAVRSLLDWGLLTGDPEELLEQQLHRRWTLHSTSHHLGLDVHDCAKARDENYRHGTLEVGMIITVEPGLYFQQFDLSVPEEFRGIGVRIEDDVLVTENGSRVLSGGIPRQVDEVEAWLAH